MIIEAVFKEEEALEADFGVLTKGEPVKDADLSITSQGRSAKYRFTSSGWKRILNIIRGSNGTINLGYGTGENYKSSQALAFDVCGFVRYPEDTNPNSAPILLKRYENSFGDDDAMATPKAKITKIRVGYPKSGTTFPNIPEGDEQDYSNSPVNCYVDVYMELDTSGLGARSCAFTMNYAGFADSNHCEPILEETDATDVGIYGEELTYYTVSVEDMPYYLNSNTGFSASANALKGSANGNQIILTDVSPIEHKMAVKLTKKSLAKGTAIQSIDFYTDSNMNEGFSKVVDIQEYFGRNDKLIFEDGTYWVGSGQTDNEINGTDNHELAEFFSIGDVAYYDGYWLCTTTEGGEEPYPNATLQTFGKNLLDINAFGLFKRREDGSYISTKKVYQNLAVNLPKGVYTYSGYIKSPVGSNYRFVFFYEDGTKQQESIASTGEYIYQSITSNGNPIKSVGFYYKSTAIIEVKNVQLELGETATEYEPYKGGTYTADENGNVKVASIYPETKLVAEDGVAITAEYNKDTNKVIESLVNAIISLGGEV